jgi:hypothetical protein
MSLNRKGTWLAIWVLGLLMGSPAWAQGLRDAQIFAPAEPSQYGGGVRPNQGFFFVYDELYWTASPPQKTTFGIDTNTATRRNVFFDQTDTNVTATQGSTFNTSFLQALWEPGQRYELGYMQDHVGYMFSYFHLHEASQKLTAFGVQSYFTDLGWGVTDLPHLFPSQLEGSGLASPELMVWFRNVTLYNATNLNSPEFNFLIRTHPGERGGIWEWYLGVRYIEFREQFNVAAEGVLPTTALASTYIDTYAWNRMFGPQLGLRWFITNDRWQFSATGKFMAAWNSQDVTLRGRVASDLIDAYPRANGEPIAMPETNAHYSMHMDVFSPVAELRFEGKYQLTRAISFKAGWTGLYLGDQARPSRMIDYTLNTTSVLGLLTGHNRDQMFAQGLNVGIEINR